MPNDLHVFASLFSAMFAFLTEEMHKLRVVGLSSVYCCTRPPLTEWQTVSSCMPFPSESLRTVVIGPTTWIYKIIAIDTLDLNVPLVSEKPFLRPTSLSSPLSHYAFSCFYVQHIFPASSPFYFFSAHPLSHQYLPRMILLGNACTMVNSFSAIKTIRWGVCCHIYELSAFLLFSRPCIHG